MTDRPSSALGSLVLAAALLVAAPAPAFAEGEPKVEPPATEAARKSAIKGLRSKLKKVARSKRAHLKHDEILETIEALCVLKGWEAGEAALVALPVTDAKVRDAIFDLVETEHDKKLVKPLAALLEDKAYRRDYDAKKRIAHALAVMADPTAIPPLTELIRGDEDKDVVAEAATSLGTYGAATVNQKREPVKKLVRLYESTWNYMRSVRPEDRILSKINTERYKVYGKQVRAALQSLTGQQLSRPHEWVKWWNKVGKKAKKWKAGER